MFIIEKKIKTIIKNKEISINKLAQLINFKNSGNLNKMILNKKSFSEKIIQKLLPILEVSRETFESWIIADKYSKEVLKLAVQAKKDFPYGKKSLLTTKIDAILQNTEMSRTALAKQIDYGQSGLNQIIIGQRTMSKPVLEKLSTAFEIPEEEILSWIVADRYKVEVLEMACKLLVG